MSLHVKTITFSGAFSFQCSTHVYMSDLVCSTYCHVHWISPEISASVQIPGPKKRSQATIFLGGAFGRIIHAQNGAVVLSSSRKEFQPRLRIA